MSLPNLKKIHTTNHPTNPLILKDDIGHPKPSVYDLPTENFSYGKPLNRDPEGVKDVCLNWKKVDPVAEQQLKPNFMALNKISLKAGVSKAKDVRTFRIESSNNIANSYKHQKHSQSVSSQRRDLGVFGIRNKPSTPMDLVMSNYYGLKAEVEIGEIYNRNSIQDKSKPKLNPKTNKSQNLKSISSVQKLEKINKLKDKEAFKLNKFKKVESKLGALTHPRNYLVSSSLNNVNIGQNEQQGDGAINVQESN